MTQCSDHKKCYGTFFIPCHRYSIAIKDIFFIVRQMDLLKPGANYCPLINGTPPRKYYFLQPVISKLIITERYWLNRNPGLKPWVRKLCSSVELLWCSCRPIATLQTPWQRPRVLQQSWRRLTFRPTQANKVSIATRRHCTSSLQRTPDVVWKHWNELFGFSWVWNASLRADGSRQTVFHRVVRACC